MVLSHPYIPVIWWGWNLADHPGSIFGLNHLFKITTVLFCALHSPVTYIYICNRALNWNVFKNRLYLFKICIFIWNTIHFLFSVVHFFSRHFSLYNFLSFWALSTLDSKAQRVFFPKTERNKNKEHFSPKSVNCISMGEVWQICVDICTYRAGWII